LPHVVRSRIVTQTANGYLPDLLVNITNDGWFRGSSILDHHLNNAILAAVENRRPMLVAANSGISAWIDGNGRVIRSIPRLEGGSILAEPNPDGRWGYWQSVGDWPARLLALISLIPMMIWFAKRFRTIALGQRSVTTRIKPVA
jgi:apolipoprotein N-acyltransferase